MFIEPCPSNQDRYNKVNLNPINRLIIIAKANIADLFAVLARFANRILIIYLKGYIKILIFLYRNK